MAEIIVIVPEKLIFLIKMELLIVVSEGKRPVGQQHTAGDRCSIRRGKETGSGGSAGAEC